MSSWYAVHISHDANRALTKVFIRGRMDGGRPKHRSNVSQIECSTKLKELEKAENERNEERRGWGKQVR